LEQEALCCDAWKGYTFGTGSSVLWSLRRIYCTFGTGSSVLWCLRRIYLWNRKLCVVVPEEDLLCDSHQQLVYVVLESRACLYELGAVWAGQVLPLWTKNIFYFCFNSFYELNLQPMVRTHRAKFFFLLFLYLGHRFRDFFSRLTSHLAIKGTVARDGFLAYSIMYQIVI
jgi:hypothetical protein